MNEVLATLDVHLPSQAAFFNACDELAEAPVREPLNERGPALVQKLVNCITHNAAQFDIPLDGILDTPAGALSIRLLAQALVTLHWARFQRADYEFLTAERRAGETGLYLKSLGGDDA